MFVEHERERLIVRFAGLRERPDACGDHCAAGQHAGAVVHQQAYGNRCVLAAEHGDCLRGAVLDDLKDVLREIAHRITAPVEHSDLQDDQIGFGGEGRFGGWLILAPRRAHDAAYE